MVVGVEPVAAEPEQFLIGRSSYQAGGSETPVEHASRDEGSLENGNIGQSVEERQENAVRRWKMREMSGERHLKGEKKIEWHCRG